MNTTSPGFQMRILTCFLQQHGPQTHSLAPKQESNHQNYPVHVYDFVHETEKNFYLIMRTKWSWHGTKAQSTKIHFKSKEWHFKKRNATHLTSGIFLNLPRNSLLLGIFIFRTDYFINVFNLIQKKKKKAVVPNTSKFFGNKKVLSSFSAHKIMDFVVFCLSFI